MTDVEPEEGPSYGTLLGRLMKDGERFAKARLKLYRALLYYRFAQARGPFIAIGVAALLSIGASIALTIGIVLAIAQLIGPLLAGIVVMLVMGGIAALLGFYAVRNLPDLTELPFEDDDIIRYDAELAEAAHIHGGKAGPS